MPQQDFLGGLLDAITSGAKHTYGQVSDDLSSLLQGSYNPGTASRVGEVLGNLPIDQLLTKALQSPIMQSLATRGGRYFHGTPNVYNEMDPAVSKASGAVGPGVGYLTNTPSVAEDYAMGATHGATPMQMQDLTRVLQGTAGEHQRIQNLASELPAGFAPNIRPYLVKNHNALVTNQPFPQEDMDALVRTLQQTLGTASPGSFQKGGAANRAANVVAAVKPQVGQEGQQIWDTLNGMLGPDRTNQILRQAGFQSIQYPGGDITGSATKHTAINVLDPSIMQNLFDALVGKPQGTP